MSQTESQTQPQQSWAAWILDAYANSVAPSHDDLLDDSLYEFTAESAEMANTSTSTSTSSAYGPYVRTGRGGAGNFTWQSQQSIDPEIQAPRSLKEKRNITLAIEHIDTAAAVNRSQQTGRSFTFPRVGRGGAGNFIAAKSTSELARQTKEREEQAEAEKRREKAEQQVSSLLQAPGHAYTGSRQRSLMPEEFESWT